MCDRLTVKVKSHLTVRRRGARGGAAPQRERLLDWVLYVHFKMGLNYLNVLHLGILVQKWTVGLGTTLGLGLPVALCHISLPGKENVKSTLSCGEKKLHLPLLSSRCLNMQ